MHQWKVDLDDFGSRGDSKSSRSTHSMASDCKKNDNGSKGGGEDGLKMPQGCIVMLYAAFLRDRAVTRIPRSVPGLCFVRSVAAHPISPGRRARPDRAQTPPGGGRPRCRIGPVRAARRSTVRGRCSAHAAVRADRARFLRCGLAKCGRRARGRVGLWNAEGEAAGAAVWTTTDVAVAQILERMLYGSRS
jgi:hypothetical protein